jgi:hypothetical protein
MIPTFSETKPIGISCWPMMEQSLSSQDGWSLQSLSLIFPYSSLGTFKSSTKLTKNQIYSWLKPNSNPLVYNVSES